MQWLPHLRFKLIKQPTRQITRLIGTSSIILGSLLATSIVRSQDLVKFPNCTTFESCVAEPDPLSHISHSSDQSQQFLSENLNLGIEAYEAGQYSAAINLLRKAAEEFKNQSNIAKQAFALSLLSLSLQELNQWSEAEQQIQQSLTLLQQYKPVDPRKLVEKAQALARALSIKAKLDLAIGNIEAAIETYDNVLKIHQELNDREGEFKAIINQAQAYRYLGYYHDALKLLVKARDQIRQPSQNPTNFPVSDQAKAKIFGDLGYVLQALGDLGQSWCSFVEGLALVQNEASPSQIQAELLVGLGNVGKALGQQDQVNHPIHWSQKKPSARYISNNEYKRLQDIQTDIRICQSNSQEGLGFYSEFLENKIGLGEAIGFYKDAEQYYRKAEEYNENSNLKSIIQLQQLEIALSILKSSDWQEVWPAKVHMAQMLWKQIYQQSTKVSESQEFEPSRTHLNQQVKLLKYGIELVKQYEIIFPHIQEDISQELDQAIRAKLPEILKQFATRAHAQAQTLEDPRILSQVLGTLGTLYQHQKALEEAYDNTLQALQATQTLNTPELDYQWYWQKAQILRDQGQEQEARSAYEMAIDTAQKSRQTLVGVDIELSTLSNQVSSSNSAISSSESYSQGNINVEQVTNNLNIDLQASFRTKIEPLYREYLSFLLTPTSGIEVSQKDLIRALTVYELLRQAELETLLRCNFITRNEDDEIISGVGNLTLAIDQQLKKIHQSHPDSAVVVPILLDGDLYDSRNDRLEIITVTNTQTPLAHVTVSLEKQKIIKSAFKLHQRLLLEYDSSRNEYRFTELSRIHQPGNQLYNWLFSEIEDTLRRNNVESLILVPDSLINKTPFAAIAYTPKDSLKDSKDIRYLIEDYAISTVPTLLALKPNHFDKQGLALLGVSLDHLENHPSLKPLDYVREEIEAIQAIAKFLGIIDLFLSQREFLWEKFREHVEVGTFSIWHIATHGQFASYPQGTYLVDSKGRHLDLNHLSDYLLYQPNLQLLVLNACETAEGDSRAVLGLAGIAIKSGAANTLGTLFEVADRPAAEITARFYRELLQNPEIETPSQALRQAQLSYLEDKTEPYKTHPSLWSAFTIVGN
jgi:CHAT domain-containing protein